jgi:hypothetical protein
MSPVESAVLYLNGNSSRFTATNAQSGNTAFETTLFQRMDKRD